MCPSQISSTLFRGVKQVFFCMDTVITKCFLCMKHEKKSDLKISSLKWQSQISISEHFSCGSGIKNRVFCTFCLYINDRFQVFNVKNYIIIS